MKHEKTYVGLPEASDALGLPLAWLRREVRCGRLPSVAVGRRRLVRLDEIEHALAERAKVVGAEGVRHA